MLITRKKKMSKFNINYLLEDGAGAGVSLSPVAFLVIQGGMVKLLPVNHSTSLDKLLDYVPDLFEKVNNMLNKSLKNKKEQTDKIISKIQKKYNKEDEGLEKVKETKIEEIENYINSKITF